MVKFSQGNEAVDRIAYKLRDMLESDVAKVYETLNNPASERITALHEHNQGAEKVMKPVDNSLDPEFWDIYCKKTVLTLIQRLTLTFCSYY